MVCGMVHVGRGSSVGLCASITYVDIFSSIPKVYISGRPFVLRDAAEPRRALKLSDRAENLEEIERRLKNDILAESAK